MVFMIKLPSQTIARDRSDLKLGRISSRVVESPWMTIFRGGHEMQMGNFFTNDWMWVNEDSFECAKICARHCKGPCHINDVLEEKPRTWSSRKTLNLRIDPHARTVVSELRKPGSRRVVGEDEDGSELWKYGLGEDGWRRARGRGVSAEGGGTDERVSWQKTTWRFGLKEIRSLNGQKLGVTARLQIG